MVFTQREKIIIAATVAALFTSRFFDEATAVLLINIVVVTLIILIFSEVSPKVFAVRQSLAFARTVSFPVLGIVTLLTPISYLFEKLTQGISHVLRIRKEKAFIDE